MQLYYVYFNITKAFFYAKDSSIFVRRCDGLVVRVPASRSPVPGSDLGPGPPLSVV